MKLLVAQKDSQGRWQRVCVLKTVADGSRVTNIPARHQGQIQTALARQAARFFAAEPDARTVRYSVAGSEWRVDRID